MIRSVMRLIIALQCLSAIVNASYFGRFDRLSTFRNSTATTDLQWGHEGSISATYPGFPSGQPFGIVSPQVSAREFFWEHTLVQQTDLRFSH